MKKVLVVDDEDPDRTMLKESLEGHCDVDTASSVEVLFKKLKKTKYDIVTLDIRFDENDKDNTDGIDALRRMRREYPKIRVIVISGSSLMEHLKEIQRLKPYTCFDKGNYSVRDLIKAIGA